MTINFLSDVQLAKILSNPVGCHFVQMIVSFAMQKLLSLLIVGLSACVNSVLFRKLPVPEFKALPPFLFYSFSVFGFILRSLIHLNLSFVQGGKYGSKMLSFVQYVFFCFFICLRCSYVCEFMSASLVQFW